MSLVRNLLNAHKPINFLSKWYFNHDLICIAQVFRLSHVVLVIIGICTFWYLQKLLERLHMKVQKSNKKAILKSKLKVMKVLYYDSHKTTSFIRIKLWKLFKECHFFPQENGCFAQNNYFLWKEYVMGHKSFLKR